MNNELKEINVQNRKSYYFDYTININDLDLDNIFLDKNSYGNILIYHAAQKSP